MTMNKALSGLSMPAKSAGKKVKTVNLGKAGSFKVHPGVFTAKAKAAEKSVHEYAEEKKSDKGKTGAQARAALGFESMHHKG